VPPTPQSPPLPQEYFIIPVGASSFKEAMQIGCECYHKLKGIIKKKFGGDATSVGDEGGFAPPCDAKEGCALVTQAIKDAGYDGKCKIGMDVAAAEFLVDGKYAIDNWYPEKEKDPSMKMGIAELTEFYKGLKKDFPDIETIEDPFDQDDWDGWTGAPPPCPASRPPPTASPPTPLPPRPQQ